MSPAQIIFQITIYIYMYRCVKVQKEPASYNIKRNETAPPCQQAVSWFIHVKAEMREARTFLLDSQHNWIVSTHLMCSQGVQGLSANTGYLNSSLQTAVCSLLLFFIYIYKSSRIPGLSFNLNSLMLSVLFSLPTAYSPFCYESLILLEL